MSGPGPRDADGAPSDSAGPPEERRPWGEEEGESTSPTLERGQFRRGHLPGNRYVRILRPREFRVQAPGHLVATERVLRPRGLFGQWVEAVRHALLGARLRSELEAQERLGKFTGLAVFASNNVSSSAYATEEVMRVLVLAGVGALALTLPITLAIIVVLAIIVTSYLQVIRAYPGGGGSYVVAKTNLGPIAGLAAAGALLTDYILTVAVSVSAGVAALTSAFPALFDHRVPISVVMVFFIMVVNLRGIRESANAFAAPTYIYIVAIFGLLGVAMWGAATGNMPAYTPPAEWLGAPGAEPLALLLIFRAFASGCVALTGTEAVSNGVPVFRPPEVRNAQIVLLAQGALFGTIFLGVSMVASNLGVLPDPHETETVLSQIARTLVGSASAYYYVIQLSTAVLLILAANTAFNGFPLLASILATDSYLPRPFQFRGDRLAFTFGIVVLALVSAALIVVYEGSVTGLIPLYTVGVFVAFTLSQLGLVRHWWDLREEEPGWLWRAAINGTGALATGAVSVVVTISKFTLGAWMVLVLIPLIAAMMWAIAHHYRNVQDALTAPWRMPTRDRPLPAPRPGPPVVVVPVSRLDRATLRAVAFARSISPDVTAVHITDDPEQGDALKERWDGQIADVPLVIVESPYRALLPPLLAYIEEKDSQDRGRPITVVLSEFVPHHFWEYFLHNQTAFRLKLRLFFRPNTIVVDVPYHLDTAGEGEDSSAEAPSAQR